MFGHCGALVPSLAVNGLIVMAPFCVNSLHPSAEESWPLGGYDQNRAEKQNVVLGRTPRGSCDNTLLRRVLRRFSRLLSRRF